MQNLKRVAREYAIEIEDDKCGAIEATAPGGQSWQRGALHCLCSGYGWNGDYRVEDRVAAIAAMIEDVRFYGPSLEDCPDDCECKG